MGEEEELSSEVGALSLRRGKKKDGTNWVMFAGGAIAMAVSVAFGRKKILEEGEEAKKRVAVASESGSLGGQQHDDVDQNGFLEKFETGPDGALQWSNSQLALPSTEDAFEFRSCKPKRPAPTDPSPPVAKFIRQGSVASEVPKDEANQCDIQASPTVQSGVMARRSEVVSRLRQQIKGRDAVIYDMQTQLADQDQMIAMHRSQCVDLQDCVQAISTKLFEANLEIRRLQRELMTQRAKPIVGLDEEFIDYAISEIKRQWVHPEDVEDIIVEARKLNKEVERFRREKEAQEKVAQAKSRQCELLSKRLSALATELDEVKSAAHGKQRLLEAKEQENLKLTNVVQDLQRRLEIEARGKESQERSMSMKRIMKRADVRNIKFGHDDDDRPITPPTTYEEVPSTFSYYPAWNARNQYGSVPGRNACKDSATRGEPRCLFGSHKKKREAPGDRVEGPENNVMIDESTVLEFEYEVDQLASALAVTSKMVSEKVQQANYLQQQDLEREMEELTKHQTKLAELKSLMAKITAKFNGQSVEDDAFNRDLLRGSAFVFDLEQKLAAQEKIAKETSLIIQQLSPSPHLSSPVQKAWRTVQETPRRPFSHNIHQEHGSSDKHSRNALHEESSSHFWERQGFPSAQRNFNQNRNKNTERQTLSPAKLPYHEFQLGVVPASTSKTRPKAGSRRQSNGVKNHRELSVSPSPETTSGFSFAHYIAEGAEQGDRMSSPEPEPSTTAPALSKRFRSNYSGSEFSLSPGFSSLVTTPAYDESKYSPLAQFGSPWFNKEEPSSRLSRPLFKSPPPPNSGLNFTTPELNPFISERELDTSGDRAKIKRLIGGKTPHSDCCQNSATPSSIGVSPFAARMAQLKVESLGNQALHKDGEDVGWGPVGERLLFNKDVEALCQSIANLEGGRSMRESRDSSGSCNPDEPVVLLPSLLRRSSESSNRHH